MDTGLRGRVALITGAGRGIGMAIARSLVAEGMAVVVNDFFEERAERAAAELALGGGATLAIAADVTESAAVAAMLDRALAWRDRLDVLVNNAGISVQAGLGGPDGGFGPRFEATTPASWRQVMDVITYGVLNCTHAALPHLQQSDQGRVINIASDAGRVGEPRLAAYSMAKGGVIAFTKALAHEVGRSGVTVNCISPATTQTEALGGMFTDPSPEGQARLQTMLRAYPLGRHRGSIGQPQDVAAAVTFLASAQAGWITGQTLSVNGGYAMV